MFSDVLERAHCVALVGNWQPCYNSWLEMRRAWSVIEEFSKRAAPIDGHCKAGT
jgi:hypothetical protein